MDATSSPGGFLEIVRTGYSDEIFERRLQVGRALPLVGENELREFLLQVKALELHGQGFIGGSHEEERCGHLTSLDIRDEGLLVAFFIECDAMPQDGDDFV